MTAPHGGARLATVLAAAALALAACSSSTGGDALPAVTTTPAPAVSTVSPTAADTSATTSIAPPAVTTVPTTASSTVAAPATTPSSGSGIAAAVAGEWIGHTRSMDLAPDGTGTISLFSGCCTGEKWTVHWELAGDTITVTLVDRLESTGGGLGDLAQGYTFTGALMRPDGEVTALHFVRPGEDMSDRDQGFFWCSERYGYTHYCGA
ncbi:hypothetical protein [Tomitella gaofuii]|uniref:hypothetical protein n=1 Tax=Tomitella gaofuii TaxID=2760083 RepID=UPI0015FB5DC0|nr:hypothetical protein [Tomitella gaofuii]